MRKGIKAAICVFLSFLCLIGAGISGNAEELTVASPETALPFEVRARSAVLMDAATGTVLYDMNGSTAYPPASVTKVMTLLLVMEAIDAGTLELDAEITVSGTAAGMGGSQIYLEPGETMRVEDLLKSVVISSANDAAVALAEAVSGSVDAFTAKMNEKAAELGMTSTLFENPTGLDDTAERHLTSAADIAVMSRELIVKHPQILKYSSIWMDTIRDGAFGLSNTNRLIRFYPGANGLKTGSTSKAKYCISAAAERDGMQLIAVVMGADTRDIRNEEAKKLLDYGFSHYRSVTVPGGDAGPLSVLGGTAETVGTEYGGGVYLKEKKSTAVPEVVTELRGPVDAPVRKGQIVGTARFLLDGEEIGSADIKASSEVLRLGFKDVFLRVLQRFLFG